MKLTQDGKDVVKVLGWVLAISIVVWFVTDQVRIGQLEHSLTLARTEIQRPGPILPLGRPDGAIDVHGDEISVNFDMIEPEGGQTISDSEYEVRRWYGPPWHNINVTLIQNKQAKASDQFVPAQCKPDWSLGYIEYRSVKNNTDWSFPLWRNVAHAFHGCFQIPDRRFEDGMANAVMFLYFRQGGGPPGYKGDTVKAATEEYRNPVPGSTHAEVEGLAYRVFELEHPGFLRRFNADYYRQLYRGQTVDDIDPVKVAEEAQPGFTKWFNAQKVFRSGKSGGQTA